MIALRAAACCVGVTLALCVAATQAHATTASPAPEGTASDCGWQDVGTSWTAPDGTVYTCKCGEFVGPNGRVVRCVWISQKMVEPKKAPKKPKPKPAPKKKPKPKALPVVAAKAVAA